MAIFEWDERKRWKTIDDRGLDFADMAEFDWSTARFSIDNRKSYGEERYISTGFLHNRLVVCVWCRRGNAIRIISLRKANEREQKTYKASKII